MTIRIGIVGAGIGGLAAASLLAQSGHAVTLAERFATPRPVGSGLVVQPVGLAVLDSLGAGQAARDLGAPLVQMLGHCGTRKVLDVRYRPGAPGLAMHRASRMAGVMPIGTVQGDPTPRAALFWSQPEAEAAAWPAPNFATWRAETTAFWPDFAAFTASLTQSSDLTQTRYSHGSLPRPYANGIAFIGDAARRASPQLGQGANMALLDAMALTCALQAASPSDVKAALLHDAAMRRWHRRSIRRPLP